MRLFRSFVALSAVLVAVPAAAQVARIDVDGRGTVIPSLGLSVDIAGESMLPTHTRSAHSVEFDYALGRARESRQIAVGSTTVIGGQTIQPSGTIGATYTGTIQFADLLYRYRYYFGRPHIALEGMVGLGWGSLGLKVDTQGGQSASEHINNAGLAYGVGALWRFIPSTALHVRILAMGSGSTEGVTSASRFDVGVQHALSRHTTVRAGYSSLVAYSERAASGKSANSEITVVARGLGLGLELVY